MKLPVERHDIIREVQVPQNTSLPVLTTCFFFSIGWSINRLRTSSGPTGPGASTIRARERKRAASSTGQKVQRIGRPGPRFSAVGFPAAGFPATSHPATGYPASVAPGGYHSKIFRGIGKKPIGSANAAQAFLCKVRSHGVRALIAVQQKCAHACLCMRLRGSERETVQRSLRHGLTNIHPTRCVCRLVLEEARAKLGQEVSDDAVGATGVRARQEVKVPAGRQQSVLDARGLTPELESSPRDRDGADKSASPSISPF